MKMEVIKPIHHTDFDFNSTRFYQQISSTAPSTPKRFEEYYCSAPSSPTHFSQFYRQDNFDDTPVTGGSAAAAAFKDEDKFAFNASETASLTAEELFDGGILRPLKPTPQKRNFISQLQPKSHTLPGKKTIKGAFSSRDEKEAYPSVKRILEHERGRETSINSYSSSRRATRSVSPLRISENPLEGEEEIQKQHNIKNSSCSSICSSSKGHKKWRLKDFFLFRSASEGRAADKDPLKKYTAAVFRRHQNSSFKGIDSPVSEDLKKKTFLPYKQGILGRLAFNPAVHALANGFGLSRK
ncbi:Hypothetical predicted protein [Olea europaea subsp. europaea]|uniref:Uncharacterized protein n=1 Tax=Olea europaea subsp. europaea TaxID=158383 RepID=A0A8S0SU02_OLEEU|nr:Hypothetical predicted protein [Olea europaea subsp. europaea]